MVLVHLGLYYVLRGIYFKVSDKVKTIVTSCSKFQLPVQNDRILNMKLKASYLLQLVKLVK